jgi:hypothetical protein
MLHSQSEVAVEKEEEEEEEAIVPCLLLCHRNAV